MTKEDLVSEILAMTNARFTEWALEHGIIQKEVGWEENKFNEFWNVFPRTTPSKRMLRAESTSAKTAKTAFAIFKREVKTKEEADIAIRGLKLELIDRQKRSGLEYMNNVQTYIRNKTWEMYADSTTEITEIDLDMDEGSSFNML